MKSLSIEHLSKCYKPWRKRQHREIWALRDVSFDVDPGTILGVIGPNGAGKTTLLKVLARITPPTAGRVVGRGRVVPLLALGAGFQPDLAGRENVFLNAAMYGIAAGEVERRFDDIVEFAGIGDLIDLPVKRYSSGMYLRLAFSVAINMDPDILLADEILAVGDAEFQERCLHRVAEAGRVGVSVLFVSHDMSAVARLCDRVLWLHAGEVREYGEPAVVVSAYQKSAWSRITHKGESKSGSHASEHGEILFVKLASRAGAEVGALRISDEGQIVLAFRLSAAPVKVRCALDVYTKGIHAFRTVQPEETVILTPGTHTASVQLPAHLLAETLYTVNASVTVCKDDAAHSLVEYNALAFNVYNTDERSSARGTYRDALPGAVSPRLAWSMSNEQDAVHARRL